MLNPQPQLAEKYQQQFVTTALANNNILIIISPHFIISEFNQAAEQKFGLTKKQALKKNFFELWIKQGWDWPFENTATANHDGIAWSIIQTFSKTKQVNGYLIQGYNIAQTASNKAISTSTLIVPINRDTGHPFSHENIIKQTPGLTYWKDKNGTILGCNGFGLNLLGLISLEELIGKTDYDFFDKELADQSRKNDLEVMESGKTILTEETSFVNGERKIFLSQKSPLRNSQNQIVGIIGTSTDITHLKHQETILLEALTAKKEVEKQKKRTEVFLKNLISNLPSHVYWKDKDGNYLGCNDVQAKSAGLDSPSQMVGKNDFDMPWKDQAAIVRKVDKEVLTFGAGRVVEESATLANGKVAIFLSHKVPLRDEQNNIIGILGISVDITERKLLEAELAAAKKKAEDQTKTVNVYLENIIAHMPGHVYWKNLKGVYLGCNERQAQMVGLASGTDVIGKTDFDLSWKEQAETLSKTDKEIMTTGIPKTLEEAVTLADGSSAIFLAHKVPLRDSNNKIIGVLGISIDITERKQAEAALIEAKKKAEIANQAKTEFLANMSHDLRTPLNGILGMTHLLKIKAHFTEQEEFIDAITTASNNLLRLIEDILNFSKLEAGKLELSSEPFELRQLIEEIVGMVTPQANQKQLKLIMAYCDDTPRHVIGDPHCIRRIIINLLGNAIKFTEQGHILIRVQELYMQENTTCLQLIIEDTGIGIPVDKIDTIFDRFSRVEPAYKGRYSGTGLGLAIVKQLVEILGGTISVVSQLHQGSIFTVNIPFEMQNLNIAATAWQRHYGDVRVLIVDDHPLRSKIILDQLASPKNFITTGDSALSTLIAAHKEHQPYQIVLIDDEITYSATILAQEIKACNEFSQIMLLLFSKPKSLLKSNQARAAGFFAQVIKPIQPSELINAITKHWTHWLSLRMTQAELLKKYAPTVLLIEDDKIAQRFTSVMLQELGCSIVDTADTGAKALIIASNNYDIIFLDIGLPDMDGFTIAQTIRQYENYSKDPVPIIALTAHVSEREKELCIVSGMSDFLQKPVSQDDLFRVLTYWLLSKKT